MAEDLDSSLQTQIADLIRTVESGNKHLAELFKQGINYEKTVLQLRDENAELRDELETMEKKLYRLMDSEDTLKQTKITELGKYLASDQTPATYGYLRVYTVNNLPENMVICNPNLHDQFLELITKEHSDYFLVDRELKKIVEKARGARRAPND